MGGPVNLLVYDNNILINVLLVSIMCDCRKGSLRVVMAIQATCAHQVQLCPTFLNWGRGCQEFTIAIVHNSHFRF